MRFARWVFAIGGLFGLAVIAPLFVLEAEVVRATGPLSHPESYYGFAVVTLAWQVVYLLIARDPVRHRDIMPIGAAGKLGFAAACWWLFVEGRTPLATAAVTLSDVLLAVLFLVAWARTPKA